jgi:ADP-ribose pyrophosphatase
MIKKWKLIKSKRVFNTPFMVINNNDYLLPNGKKAHNFYKLERRDYVLIVVFNNDGKILVEKQYRWGANDFVYELPAGWINENEFSLEAAGRELREETGYVLKNAKELGVVYAQPGFCNMSAHIVKGFSDKLLVRKPEFDEEAIELSFMSKEEIQKKIKMGIIKDMGFITAMSFLD